MLVALLALLTAAFAAPEMIPLDAVEVVGHAAPKLDLRLADGSPYDLAKHRGRVVVVSFWASWCGPCRLELPALTELAAQRKDIDFIAVNVDRRRADAERFLKSVPVGVPLAYDSEAAALGEFLVLSMPTTFVIDPKGVVYKKKVGFSKEKGLTELIGFIDEAKKR